MPSEYELAFFKENGFTRAICPSCGRAFWSQGTHATCGETPCQEYEFIGRSPMKRKLELGEMRETFLRFFEDEGHPRVSRYPVVARWRNDVFYTQASIYPFQPWVIEGLAEPPANPLGISQPCVRFNDLDNVGKTGQHFTLFEMMAHHAFNAPKRVYFKERTTELCHRFLTSELGIDAPGLRYVESWWAGGGYSGPCFEVTTNGAEVATLVFMKFRGEEDGEPLDGPVVDTGYGLERLTWVSQGSPSAYEAVFGDVLEALKGDANLRTDERVLAEYSKVAGGMSIETHGDVRRLRSDVADRLGLGVEELTEYTLPLEYVYALSDHTRALAFVLGDGVVPSNVKEGYFARLLVRRALRALDRLDIHRTLSEILSLQIEHFAKDFPELPEWEEEILKLAEVEAAKYAETLKRGRRIVKEREAKLPSKAEGLTTDDLVELYDSHGLVPEVVQEFAERPVEVPDDFFGRVAQRHLEAMEEAAGRPVAPPGFPLTRIRYYEDPKRFAFEATYLGKHNGGVVLDETFFYPEGGGQEADHGTIGKLPVTDVQLLGGVAVHQVKGKIGWKKGAKVTCHVDERRRMRLLRHHTATHLVNGAARKVLGRHVWQTGAHKAEDHATLDITHYQGLTEEEVQAIETLANQIVLEDRPVHQHFVPREEAEAHHGFVLYQGGSIPGRDIRVVDVEDFDVEGCGGTHALHTGEVGLIKVVRSRRIQDGVVRLEFVAGDAALDRFRQRERTLQEASEVLRTKPGELPHAAERLMAQWKDLSRRVERTEKKALAEEVEELLAGAGTVGEIRLVVHERKGTAKDLVALARELLQHPGIVGILAARNGSASLLIGRSEDVALDAREAISSAAELLGGSGGGKPDLAQGGGPRTDRLGEALSEAEKRVRGMLEV